MKVTLIPPARIFKCPSLKRPGAHNPLLHWTDQCMAAMTLVLVNVLFSTVASWQLLWYLAYNFA